MVVKDVDSVMTCGAVPDQMLNGDKHFANTVPCNTGLSNESHSFEIFLTPTSEKATCVGDTYQQLLCTVSGKKIFDLSNNFSQF